jgi:hypothetical protein
MDELSTPALAIEPLVPFIYNFHDRPVLWEPAPGKFALLDYLEAEGFKMIVTTGNYFDAPFPDAADILVTNPPFSKKIQWLAKAREDGKPFALLLPITTLGVRRAHPSLYGVQIVFLKKRIDFTGKGRPWFSVAWFTWGLDLPAVLNFPDLLA